MGGQEIDNIEKKLWEEVQTILMEEIHIEVEEWVMNSGTNTGRASAYDEMLMVYWVLKNLMVHVAIDGEAKGQGDQEPVRDWKELH